MEIRKILVVEIILLFISVAIAPGINFSVVKASTDNDLVEVTTQACGIKGYGDTTVKLTRQQYNDLEQVLVEFRARLNQTTTSEEAVPIFKEAVVELNKYGLLPKRMSVEQAQKLVIGENQNGIVAKIQERLLHNNLLSLNNTNFFCLVAGDAINVDFLSPVRRIVNTLFLLYGGGPNHSPITWVLLLTLDYFFIVFSMINPFAVYDLVGLGVHADWSDSFKFPAEGWIDTFGLLGHKKWNRTFYGSLPISVLPSLIFYIYPGIIGFTGIQITIQAKSFFLGSAILVKISSGAPP
jgi:hypothetical protein